MATSTSLVTGVDFVVVPTRNFDASVEFYGTVLGLPCTARYGQMPGAEFETGSLTLAVMATEEFGMGSRAPTADTSVVALVVVDAENVRRSRWPNISREGLVDRAREWAVREGHDLLIVFDGEPPEQAPDLVGSRDADDAIVELTARLDRPWWLVSSDRGLRARLGDRPARIIGGGSFSRTI